MSLSQDIENIFLDIMEYDKQEDPVTKSAMKRKSYQIGVRFSRILIEWLQKQEFSITEMKAIVKLEQLQTTGDIQADIKNSLKAEIPTSTVMLAAGAPNPTPVPLNMSSFTTKNSVRVPKLRLNNKGGQGGSMDAIGYAYVGANPVSPNESGLTKTKVKLINVKDR